MSSEKSNPIDWELLLEESEALSLYVLIHLALLLILWLFLILLMTFCSGIRCFFGRRMKPSGRKVIIVTGATSGMGLTLAKHYYLMGFSIVATYRSTEVSGYKELSELAKSGSAKENRLFLVQLDVTSQKSIDKFSNEVDSLLAKNDLMLYCLLNNAGVLNDGPFEWTNDGNLKVLCDTNFTGVVLLTRKFAFRIIKNKGRIVMNGSGLQFAPVRTLSVYTATKCGLRYLSEAIDLDIGDYGASSICVMPGNHVVDTNVLALKIKSTQEAKAKLSEEERQYYKSSIDSSYGTICRLIQRKLFRAGIDPLTRDLEKSLGLPDGLKLDPELKAMIRDEKSKPGGFCYKIKEKFKMLVSGGPLTDEHAYIEGFDIAIRNSNPPRRLFAGNYIYTYITGPIADSWVPYGIVSLFGPFVHHFI